MYTMTFQTGIMLLFPKPSYHQTWPPGSLRTGGVVHSTGRMAAPQTLWCIFSGHRYKSHLGHLSHMSWPLPLLNSGAISALTCLHGCETLKVADVRACTFPARRRCPGSCCIFVPTLGIKRRGNSKHPKEGWGKKGLPPHRSKCPFICLFRVRILSPKCKTHRGCLVLLFSTEPTLCKVFQMCLLFSPHILWDFWAHCNVATPLPCYNQRPFFLLVWCT